MEQQQIVESSGPDAVDVKAEVVEPEPQLDASFGSPVDDASKKKKKKKKKKSRRKSLEKSQSEVEDLIEELKANDDQPQSEEEDNQASSIEDEENQESTVTEKSTVAEESTVPESTVAEETTVSEESSTAESTVTKESTVTQESTVMSTVTESTVTEVTTIEKDTVATDDVSEDELGPPPLDRTSSLDTLKATGTKAVGSLFSKFKVGRKKPLPSRTESAAKLEGVVPSPVKTAVKKLEVPEEKNLDDLPVRTKREFFGDGEQTVHVSAEKEKYDALEKQRKEKEAEEAARHTPPSSMRSNEELQAQIAVASEQFEVDISKTVESSIEISDKEVVDSNGADSNVAIDLESSEVVVEGSAMTGDVTLSPASADKGESTVSVEKPSEVTSVLMDTAEYAHKQITTGVDEDNAASESTTNGTTETSQDISGTAKMEPVSLKLDLNLDLDLSTEASEAQSEKVSENTVLQSNEVVEALTTASVEDGTSLKTEQSETTLPEQTELLSVKVTPPAELAAAVTESAKPEKMSPVKSLASRFEGKREQSLDSLKFRTVREFFPTERSIRVGAEKQKYEAQAQQQQQKAKAEEEAKSKYKTGSGFKSTDKESVSGEPSPSFKAAASDEPVIAPTTTTSTELAGFSTPDNASSRKKFSFDEGHVSANSPSKFSDEALTPVKSIASRFEGKREQSLDSLKFRTVREFFPEERSVRVGSEKQKFEAQAQQDKSLDALKFRTVREFFPDEGKRSVHVGAEKAKFEALTKQQDEAAKAAEQIKLKHAALSPTPTSVKLENSEGNLIVETANEGSPSTLDESQLAADTSVAVTAPEPKDVEAVELTDTNAAVEADVNESLDVAAKTKDASRVDVASVAELSDNSSSTDHVATTVGDATNLQNQVTDAKAAVSEPTAPTNTDEIDLDKEVEDVSKQQPEENVDSTEVFKIEQKTEKDLVDVGDRLVDLDIGDSITIKQEEFAGSIEESTVDEQVSTNFEKAEENKRVAHVVDPTIEKGLGALDLGEPVVDERVEANIDVNSNDLAVSEQVNLVEAEHIVVVDEKPQNSELVELDLGEPVVKDQFESSVSALSNGSIASDEVPSLDIQQPIEVQQTEKESQSEDVEIAPSTGNGTAKLDLGEAADEAGQSNQQPKLKRPMLTTERSFVIEDDQTIETEDTVVVGERPMTDGEDEFEPLSSSKARPAHELFAGINSSKAKKELKKKTLVPKLTRKISTGSVGSAKSPAAKTTVSVPMKRALITVPTASYSAKKTAETDELHKASPQLKKQGSASKLKGTGFIKPSPAAPTVPVPMKRASITAPTASYKAKKAAEEAELHKASPKLKKQGSASKLKGTVSETGFVKPPPAAPTVPVPMRRASITAPTASSQARNVPDHSVEGGESRPAPKNHASKPSPTVPVAPKRASIMAPTASYRAKKTAEHENISVEVPSAPARNKRYSTVKSKVLEGIQSGSTTHAVAHKMITKEEFIAAERRKSLGSAGVRSVLDAVDRRASLTARVTIDGPPEPFVRSALSRKKLNSTVPRYLDYENTPGYAERARKQHERRKRLEEENAAKSEKRQHELRVFFSEKQQKSLMSSADEVRRGLEAHEFAKLAKESEIEAQKALRREKQRARSTRSHSSATSSAGVSSSNGAASRTSKKSSISTLSVEDKIVEAPVVESTVMKTEEVVASTTVVTEEIVELQQELEETVINTAVEVETIPVPVVDDDPALEHVAKKIDFDATSTDSDDKGVSNE